MKKLVLVIIAVFYLGASTGTSIYLHYCMGKLVSRSLMHHGHDSCVKCGMKKDGGCCQYESNFVKNTADQNILNAAPTDLRFLAAAALPPLVFIFHQSWSYAEPEPVDNAPPQGDVPKYLRYRVFLI